MQFFREINFTKFFVKLISRKKGQKLAPKGIFIPIFKPIVESFKNNKICAHWVHFEFKNGTFICVFYERQKVTFCFRSIKYSLL